MMRSLALVSGFLMAHTVALDFDPLSEGKHSSNGECVRAVDFIADGSRIVSGGEDATVRLWNYGASLTQEYSQAPNHIIYGLEASLDSDFMGGTVALVLTHSEC